MVNPFAASEWIIHDLLTPTGYAHAALIPLTASANSLLILLRQPLEGRQFTWAGT